MRTKSDSDSAVATSYIVRAHYAYINYTTGQKQREPSGWDVWEITPTHECIVSPCDTREEADAVFRRLTFWSAS